MQECSHLRRDSNYNEFENFNNSVLEAIVGKLEEYRFPAAVINDTLMNSTMNHLAATYILLIHKHIMKD